MTGIKGLIVKMLDAVSQATYRRAGTDHEHQAHSAMEEHLPRPEYMR